MIIYRPQFLLPDQIDLKTVATELVKILLPEAEILSTQVKGDDTYLLVRHFSTLIAFKLCTVAVGEEAFESILKLLLDLESMRKIQNDPLLKDVGVYWLASRFSNDFLKRLPFVGLGVQLFEWCFIHSQAKAATGNAIYLKKLESSEDGKISSCEIAKDLEARLISGDTGRYAHLTTPEVIALTSLGLEIRNSRFQKSAQTA